MFGINFRSVRRFIIDAFLFFIVFSFLNVFFELFEFVFMKIGCFCLRIVNSGFLMSMLRSILIFCMMNNFFVLARFVFRLNINVFLLNCDNLVVSVGFLFKNVFSNVLL